MRSTSSWLYPISEPGCPGNLTPRNTLTSAQSYTLESVREREFVSWIPALFFQRLMNWASPSRRKPWFSFTLSPKTPPWFRHKNLPASPPFDHSPPPSSLASPGSPSSLRYGSCKSPLKGESESQPRPRQTKVLPLLFKGGFQLRGWLGVIYLMSKYLNCSTSFEKNVKLKQARGPWSFP